MVEPYRKQVYEMLTAFEKQVDDEEIPNSHEYAADLRELKELVHQLLGPEPGKQEPVMMRDKFGQTRWGKAKEALQHVLYMEKWDYSDTSSMGKKVLVPRIEEYKGTALAKLFPYLEENLENMMLPRLTFYWRFLSDISFDAHIFGGIRAEVLGTFYLVLGTMIFAIPLGVIAAIYLAEFSKETSKIVSSANIVINFSIAFRQILREQWMGWSK